MLLCPILQKLKLQRSSSTGAQHKVLGPILNEWYAGCEIIGNQLFSTQGEDNYQETPVLEAMEKGTLLCTAAEKSDLNRVKELLRCGADANIIDAYGQTALHMAVQRDHFDLIKILLERGANMHKPDARGWTPKEIAQEHGNNDVSELLSGYENRTKLLGDDQTQTADRHRNSLIQSNCKFSSPFRYRKHAEMMPVTCFEGENHSVDSNHTKLESKRITVHMHPQISERSPEQFGKLINLPDSLQELFRIGGKYCLILQILTPNLEEKRGKKKQVLSLVTMLVRTHISSLIK